MMVPRSYQIKAHDNTLAEWDKGTRSTLLEMATGTGKTVVFSMVCKTMWERRKRTLVLAHRDELIRQAADKLMASTGLDCAVEKGDERGDNSMFPVVVASVQTLMRAKRLARFAPDEFGAIVTDEAHHALADSYVKIFQRFPTAKMLGVTATPDRGDKRNLGKIFETVAFQYGLRQAIQEGFLAKVVACTVPLKLDMSQVGVKAGDYSESDLGDALEPYLERIADEVVKRASNRKTLAFLPLRVTSRKFADICRSRGIDTRHVDGESDDRDDVKKWLASPGPKLCTNAMLFTEGFDEPSIDCLLPLRVTKSRALYAQMVGRGTRLFPGKSDVLLLDFLWQTETHDLCKPCNLIAAGADLMSIMTKIQEEKSAGGTEQLDLLDLEQMAENEATAQRHEALARALKDQEKKKGRMVDPLMLSVMLSDGDLNDYEPTMKWEGAKPTEPQLKALARFGVNPDTIKTKGHASVLLTKMMERSKLKLASIGKIQLLGKFGYGDVGTITEKEANALIDVLKCRNWQSSDRWSFG